LVPGFAFEAGIILYAGPTGIKIGFSFDPGVAELFSRGLTSGNPSDLILGNYITAV